MKLINKIYISGLLMIVILQLVNVISKTNNSVMTFISFTTLPSALAHRYLKKRYPNA